ncbi:hypothetical protein LCGC14_0638430 [marine sediment metagenome]|uniref:Uncharacterized protein n=1 Tax=marine sediment metagenome TaxID=412755 RepID=A0A0F9U8B4_9ZZZZ
MLIMQFTPYVKMFRNERPRLPLNENLPKVSDFKNKIPKNIATATGYRNFLELASEYGGHTIAQFRALRDKSEL